jgi:hypothetical protein
MTLKELACRAVARSAFGESSFQPAYALRATARQSSLFVVCAGLPGRSSEHL